MIHRSKRLEPLLIAAILAPLAVVGCGSTGATSGPVFIPPPPAKPRLQLLLRFGSEAHLRDQAASATDWLGRKADPAATLSKPYSAVMNRGKIYVTDTGLGSLVVVDLAERRFRHLRGEQAAGTLKVPINMAFDKANNLYVTDTGRQAILVYDAAGNHVRNLHGSRPYKPGGIAIRAGQLYVTDLTNHQVVVMDPSGRELRRFGTPGRGPGQLSYPTGIALDANGAIYVSEALNARVQKFSPNAELLMQFGRLGRAFGEFVRPKGVAMAPGGNLYVADAATEHVQIFDPSGRLLLVFGGNKGQPDSFYLPAGVSITKDPANLAALSGYVADDFEVEYLVIVVSQYGPTRVSVFGFGQKRSP